MSRLPQRSADRLRQLADVSPSVRSSGAMVAVPPAAWMRSSTCFERLGGAGGEDDVGAGRGERFGGRRANAAAGAGDKRELAVKRFRDSVMTRACSG